MEESEGRMGSSSSNALEIKIRRIWRRAFDLGFSKGSVYILTAILQRLANFFLMALLLKCMLPEDFSRYGLYTGTIMLITPLFSMNLHLAPGRLIFDYDQEHRTERANLLTSALGGALGLASLSLGVTCIALVLLGLNDPLTAGSTSIKVMVALTILFNLTCDFTLSLMRALARPWIRLCIVLLQSYGVLAMLLLVSMESRIGFKSFLICQLLTAAMAGTVALSYSRPTMKGGKWEKSKIKDAFLYSSPTVVHLAAAWGIQYSGRWIGSLFIDLGQLAPYTLATQLINIIAMFSRSIFDAQIPTIGECFAKGRRREGKKVLLDTSLFCSGTLALLYLGIFLLVNVLGISLPRGYQLSGFILWIAFATNVFDLIYLRNSHLFAAEKKTHMMAVGTIVSGCLAMAANFVLAKNFGVNGLMLAMLAGMACQALVTSYLARVLSNRMVDTTL